MKHGSLTAILTTLGAVFGALGGYVGLVVGAMAGFAIGRQIALDRRIKNLEQNGSNEVQAGLAEARNWTRDVHAWLEESAVSTPEADDEAAADSKTTHEPHSTPSEHSPEQSRSPAPASTPEPASAASAPTAPMSAPEAGASPRDLTPAAKAAAFEAPRAAEAPVRSGPAAADAIPQARQTRIADQPAQIANGDAKPPFDPLAWLVDRLKKLVTTGNAPVKAGVVISLIGIGLLLREANRRGLIEITIEARLIAAAAFGSMLLAIGWRQRKRRPDYGLALQGGGIAVLYVTVFAAYAVYDVLAAAPAGSCVAVITISAGVLAVVEDSRMLAILGMTGGFLAPVLTYRQPDDHVWVFGLFCVLNAAIVAITWFKSWPELNLAGFGFTFGLTAFWLSDRSDVHEWASTQPFIAFFVLLYMTMPTAFAIRAAPDFKALSSEPPTLGEGFLREAWTHPLVFSTPFIGLGLQNQAVGHTEHGLVISAVSLAAALAVLALLARKIAAASRSLSQSYAHLAVVFTAIAAPLAFDSFFTSTVWTVQGYVLLRLGCRRQRRLALAAGIVLQLLGALMYVEHLAEAATLPHDDWPIVNRYFLGALLIAVAALVSGWHLQRRSHRGDLYRIPSVLALSWGAAWWLGGGLAEIASQLSSTRFAASLGFAVVSLCVAGLAARRLKWRALEASGLLILPTMVIFLWVCATTQSHPLDRWGWIGWPVALGSFYLFLRLREDSFPKLLKTSHAGGYWTLAVIVMLEVHWQVDRATEGAWAIIATLAAMLVLGISPLMVLRTRWPVVKHWPTYLSWCSGAMLAVAASGAACVALGYDGDLDPLPFVPVANPLIVVAVCSLMALRWWRKLAKSCEADPFEGLGASRIGFMLAAAGTLTLTMETARAVHHTDGVAWNAADLIGSTTLQASLSVLWAAIALSAMIAGVRLARRSVWAAGASLMAVVVAKLFLVDLGNLAAVSRVVSFLGVGVLLLTVGYFAPVPPASPTETQSNEQPRINREDH